jgi:uncharacterized membrane protein
MDARAVTAMDVNIGRVERFFSAAAGAALLYWGIRRRSWPGGLLAFGGGNLLLRGLLGKSLVYRSLGISTARAGSSAQKGIRVDKAILIGRPPEEVYRFWRNLENLPRIMAHLKAVRNIDDRTSHWVAKGPVGSEVEWDAEIIEDQENRRIGWRSLQGSDVQSQGSVTFGPAGDGRDTDLRVSLEYQPPGGVAGAAVATIFGTDPAKQIDEDLQRFRRLLETGELTAGRMA